MTTRAAPARGVDAGREVDGEHGRSGDARGVVAVRGRALLRELRGQIPEVEAGALTAELAASGGAGAPAAPASGLPVGPVLPVLIDVREADEHAQVLAHRAKHAQRQLWPAREQR